MTCRYLICTYANMNEFNSASERMAGQSYCIMHVWWDAPYTGLIRVLWEREGCVL